MNLSQSDIQRIAAFVRKVTKAPSQEAIVSESFEMLKDIGGIGRLRVVFSAVPGRWTEWKSETNGLEVSASDEWPAPELAEATAFFDTENQHSGYISSANEGEKLRSALDIVAPEVWSALLLKSAVDRAQRASISETELVRATLRARDEERRRIARELHDDLGQSLACLKLGLQWTEDGIRKKRPPDEVIEELSKARQDVGAMLDKMRDLSHTLYPQILDTLGLPAALKELAHQASRFSQMTAECRVQGKPKPLPKETEVTVYRCCQEAINNAIRHSEASKLLVLVSYGRSEVRAMIEDDGKGFEPRTLCDSGSKIMSSGFWTIRQRMADIGAAFRVSTAKGQGTLVELIVPYSSREDHDKRKDKTAHCG